jgi:uncharacterized protein (UPF0332 family)
MNSRDYLTQAAELVGKESPTTADLRSAVSRAYYATFNVAVALLKKIGVKAPASWEGHKLVAEALRYSEDSKVQAACGELDDLRKARWKADYDMEDEEVEHQRTVAKFVARAKQAIKKLDECEADAARFTQVRNKLRTWAGSRAGSEKGFILG